MNRKQFFFLLIALVLVGAAGWLVYRRGTGEWQSTGQAMGAKLLPNLPVNDIAQILIQSATNQVTLERRDNLWRVRERGDYPANFSQISDMLLKFADLKIVQSQPVGPSQLGRFQLLPLGQGWGTNAGTLVSFQNAGGATVASILLGKPHMKQPTGNSEDGDEGWPDGRYVMALVGHQTLARISDSIEQGPERLYSFELALISDSLDNVQPAPETWLNKTCLSIEKPLAISADFPQATNSWRLVRASETNGWQLANPRRGEKLDESKIDSVTSPFSSVSFNDVQTVPAKNDTNVATLAVETSDGLDYTAKIGAKQDDEYPVTFFVAARDARPMIQAASARVGQGTNSDADIKKQQKQMADKLANDKQYENWVYLLPSYDIDSLLKVRGDLLEATKTNAVTSTGK